MSQIKHYTTTLDNDNQPQHISNLEDGAVVYAKNTTTGASRLYIKEQVNGETPYLTNIGESLDEINIQSISKTTYAGTDDYAPQPCFSVYTSGAQDTAELTVHMSVASDDTVVSPNEKVYKASHTLFAYPESNDASVTLLAGYQSSNGTTESSIKIEPEEINLYSDSVIINTSNNRVKIEDTSNSRVNISSSNGLLISSDTSSIEMPSGDPYVNINGDTNISGTLDVSTSVSAASGSVSYITTDSITCSKDVSGDTYKIYLGKGSSPNDYPEISFSFKYGEGDTEEKFITMGYHDEGTDVYGSISCNGTITSTGGAGFSTSKGYHVWKPNPGSSPTHTLSVDENGNIVTRGTVSASNYGTVLCTSVGEEYATSQTKVYAGNVSSILMSESSSPNIGRYEHDFSETSGGVWIPHNPCGIYTVRIKFSDESVEMGVFVCADNTHTRYTIISATHNINIEVWVDNTVLYVKPINAGSVIDTVKVIPVGYYITGVV